ncbi:MAG: hypothetical protein ACYSUP_10800 [Planctomycetota bacterium]
MEPFVYIHGQVRIGQDCRIGPFVYLSDGTVVSDGSCVEPARPVSQENTEGFLRKD